MFYSTFYYFAYNSTTSTIPTGLFNSIDTSNASSLAYMFYGTFNYYAYNSTTAAIPTGLFNSIDASQADNLNCVFYNTFSFYAYNSTTAAIPSGLFNSVDTSNASSLSYAFYGTFDHYAYNSKTATIPTGLFSSVSISSTITNSTYMFFDTFSYYAHHSTVGTIPANLFSTIDTSNVTYLNSMFAYTFYNYAHDSAAGTIPSGIFSSINVGSGAVTSSIFNQTFSGYAQRQAQFVVTSSVVAASSTFTDPYSVKVGANGVPSDNPSVSPGDAAYPTYNAAARTIAKPTGTYAGYDWYYKDGTSCAAATPTPDCGVQDSATLATFPNTTEWTPTTSTEKGNVTFYGVLPPPYIELSLSSNLAEIGGSGGMTPTSAGVYGFVANTATTKTNNSTGYYMTISTNQPSTNPHAKDLKHVSLNSYVSSTANTCAWNSATKTLTNTTNVISNNTWGFTLGMSNATGQKLCQIPDEDNPLIIKQTGVANESGDITTIYFGSKVDTAIPSGKYQTTVVYTVVAN
jgi:hypothetical protein